VSPTAEELLTTTAAIVWYHDAPTPMRGRFPEWHVMKAASDYVTVVLAGDGSDELLAGYDRFVLPFLLDRLDPGLPNRHSRLSLIGEVIRLGQVSHGAHRVLPPLLRAALAGRWRRLRRGGDGRRTAARDNPLAAAPSRPYKSRLNNALWHELRTIGLPEMLHGSDALSMAFSLESRMPFLDHRLVEFCFSLAYEEKIGAGWTKWLLRRATQGILPEPVRLRRRKLGFPGDYSGWMGSGNGLDKVRDLLLDPKTLGRGWLDAAALRRTFGGTRRAAERWVQGNPQTTWRTVTFELWCRLFLDDEQALRPAPTARMRDAPTSNDERPVAEPA